VQGQELAYSQLLIQGWFHQDGVIIGVIDRDSLRSLGERYGTFADLVLERFDALRFVYASQDDLAP
jgi:hypothetical protein